MSDILIPKGNSLGWTLNFENPVSWVLLAAFSLGLFLLLRKKLATAVLLLKAYFVSRKK